MNQITAPLLSRELETATAIARTPAAAPRLATGPDRPIKALQTLSARPAGAQPLGTTIREREDFPC
ncbi:MAG: hypothetical protein Q8L66_12570 [Caulobacter sp.]|nr:hypothetical protein [Caulobacter sp.]